MISAAPASALSLGETLSPISTRILETARKPSFDRLARLASRSLRAPIACFGVVDEQREIVCSAVGLSEPRAGRREFAVGRSIAALGAATRAPLALGANAALPAMITAREVTGSQAPTGLVAPVITAGRVVGALWVLSPEPRAWSRADLELLDDLAACVEREVTHALCDAPAVRTSRAPGGNREAIEAMDRVSLYATLVATLPRAAVALFDHQLRCIALEGAMARANPDRAALIGGSMAAVVGLAVDDPRHRPLEALYRAALEGRSGTADHRTADGRVLELNIAAVRAPGGAIAGGCLLALDKTAERAETAELERTKALLARERVLLASTLEHIPDGVALRDANGAIVLANRRLSDMLGLEPAVIPGMPRDRYLAHVAELTADPAGFMARFDGEPRPHSATDIVFARPRRRVLRRTETAVALPEGAGATLVTWRDVTAEHDIVQRLRLVLERAPVGVALISRGAGQANIHLNLRAERMVGDVAPGPPRADGSGLYRLDGSPILWEDAPSTLTLRGEEVELVELYLVHRDGRRTYLHVRGTPLFGDDGSVIGGVLGFEDITAQKEVERLRAEWNALIAHDLRSPLNHIGLHGQLLARSLEEPHASSAREIGDAVARMNRMVRDLLDLSRLEAKHLELRQKPTKVEEVVRSAVDRASMGARARFALSVEGEPKEAWIDRDRIAQVLDNLLSNAEKYGDGGATIDVVVRALPGAVEVAVTNRGQSLPEEAVKQLFQRFRRGPHGAAREVQGVGLGLYIARELVEAHGGTIRAETRDGCTIFRFVLPALGA